MKYNTWICSRVFVVRLQHIHVFMPTCVLEEILMGHGLKYSRKGLENFKYRKDMVQYIESFEPMYMKYPFELEDYRILAAYINCKEEEWTKSILEISYAFIQNFNQDRNISLEDVIKMLNADHTFDRIPFGPMNATNPISMDACILYRLCKDNGLNPSVNSTLEDMRCGLICLYYGIGFLDQYITSTLFYSSLSLSENINRLLYLQPQHKSYEQNINLQHLLNSYIFSHHEKTKDKLDIQDKKNSSKISYADLKQWADNLDLPSEKISSEVNNVGFYIRPSTDIDAIGFAGFYFDIDLSIIPNPIMEYMHIVKTYKNKKSLKKWTPLNQKYKRFKLVNPTLFRLSTSFNPLFPKLFYSFSSLIQFSRLKGLTNSQNIMSSHEFENVYQELQFEILLSGFYIGIYPEIKNKETPVYWEEIKNIHPSLILCYGVRHQNLIAYTIEEWIDHFQNVKTFQSLHNNKDTISNEVINNLKYVLQYYVQNDYPTISKNTLDKYRELLNIIRDIEFLNHQHSNVIRSFCKRYNTLSEEDQKDILRLLRLIMDTGLIMRGWDGSSSNYPIQSALVSDNLLVDQKSGEMLNIYIHDTSKNKKEINKLPLLNFKNGKYVFSTSINDGYTIGERMNIVVEGNNTDNIASCIRMTSNWFVSSSYRYLTLLKEKIPFDITSLSQIS